MIILKLRSEFDNTLNMGVPPQKIAKSIQQVLMGTRPSDVPDSLVAVLEESRNIFTKQWIYTAFVERLANHDSVSPVGTEQNRAI